jgi:hypothetical protein
MTRGIAATINSKSRLSGVLLVVCLGIYVAPSCVVFGSGYIQMFLDAQGGVSVAMALLVVFVYGPGWLLIMFGQLVIPYYVAAYTLLSILWRRRTRMKRSDFQVVGLLGVVLGAISLVGGMVARTFYTYPYSDLTIPMLLAGTILVIVGLVFLRRASQEPGEADKAPAPQNLS